MAGTAARGAGGERWGAQGKRTRVGGCGLWAAGSEEGLKKRQSRLKGITFDAGGLIALDRKDRRVLILLARAKELGLRITIPATALAQVLRAPARQALLSRLIRQAGTDLASLDGPDARAVGLLLAQTASSDIVDAHVVVCARRAGQPVLTSDPDDLRRIAPELRLTVV